MLLHPRNEDSIHSSALQILKSVSESCHASVVWVAFPWEPSPSVGHDIRAIQNKMDNHSRRFYCTTPETWFRDEFSVKWFGFLVVSFLRSLKNMFEAMSTLALNAGTENKGFDGQRRVCAWLHMIQKIVETTTSPDVIWLSISMMHRTSNVQTMSGL